MGGWRCSPLNAALVANEKNAAKSEYFGANARVFGLGFAFQKLALGVCENLASVVFVVWICRFRSQFTC
ncbi:hypothetical protein D047_5081 [Vibrio parahaemolyticus VPTS-2010_2]|nr:hypothetical protein D047_5081 [Vibrio parahaemolyticus VPTS-2010_2]